MVVMWRVVPESDVQTPWHLPHGALLARPVQDWLDVCFHCKTLRFFLRVAPTTRMARMTRKTPPYSVCSCPST